MINSYPPLGLGYLAAVAEQDGHEVRIHDFGLYPSQPLEEDARQVADYKPDLVAFTSMTTSYHYVEQLVQRLKGELGVPVIIGGPHATTMPDATLANPNIDYLIYGEGEHIWQDFLRALESGDTRWGEIPGLWYKDEGKVVPGGSRKPIEDLDALPFPSRHLYDLSKYPLYAPNGEPMLTILSSRGCPYACSFCFKGIVGRSYHQRSPENIVEELKQVSEAYGIRNFYFIDDLFTIDVKRLEKILDYFIDQRLDYRWRCLARVDRVTPELLKKMYRPAAARSTTASRAATRRCSSAPPSTSTCSRCATRSGGPRTRAFAPRATSSWACRATTRRPCRKPSSSRPAWS
ncbi:MAG: radical SAM protein [Caldilineales bacterium]